MTVFRGLFAALVGAQLAYPFVPAGRRPAATRGVVVLMLAASTAEAVAARGRAQAALVGSAGGLGFAIELVGVRTGRPFGHYHYGAGLGPMLGSVPLLAAGAWAMMARPAWVVAGWLDPRAAVRIPLAAGALTAWDVFLDPRMAADGYWTWPGGGRYEGVPASNFLGWLLTGCAVFGLWAVAERGEPPAAADDGALALYTWTWVGETVANAMLWRRRRVAFAGAAAMGSFAVPALVRRLRG